MKVIIENYIYNDDNLLEVNHFVMLCTGAEDEQELRDEIHNLEVFGAFDCLEEKGIRYGFGHHHFWVSENWGSDGWQRILFVDFTDQSNRN